MERAGSMEYLGVSLAKRDEGIIAQTLGRAYALATGPMGHETVGPVDLAFSCVEFAGSRLSQVRPQDAAKACGEEAANALRDVRVALQEAEDAYGAVAGPDRTSDQLDALVPVFVAAIHRARASFGEYARQVADVVAYDPATSPLPEVLLPAAPASRPPVPARTVPAVRPRLDADEAERLARRALGCAFGGLVVAITRLRVSDDKARTLFAGALTRPAAQLISAHSVLERRAAHGEAALVEAVGTASAALEGLLESAMPGMPEMAKGKLDADAMAAVQAVSRAIRSVDAFALENAAPAPAP